MRFLCYTEMDQTTIASNLGDADYSYYFVQQAFLPLLKTLGDVELVHSVDQQLPSVVEKALQIDGDCVLLAFAPPHKVPENPGCPVIPVFAWEYSTLPNQQFIDNPRDNWSYVLAECGQAITHSSYALQTVHSAIRSDFPVASLPAPIWDYFQEQRDKAHARQARKSINLPLNATIIDSAEFNIDSETIFPASTVSSYFDSDEKQVTWNGDVFTVSLGAKEPGVFPIGFYDPEGWGAWSKSSSPWIMMPIVFSGKILLTICASAYGKNIGRKIKIRVGSITKELILGSTPEEQTIKLDITKSTNYICFFDLDLSDERSAADPRSLGIGITSISIEADQQTGKKQETIENAPPEKNILPLDGVIYTSILNPKDGRKNWEDILTGFCLAFRENKDATLILKMTYKDLSAYLDDIFALFCQLHPFSCRVVVIHGYIDDEDYNSLIDATSFIVNASRCEGQCLPLMEYMSSGIPAIAPNNTAMKDYVNENNSFIVDSTPEPIYWPQDPRQVFRTLWYRPNWESLYNAYLDSYNIAINSPEKYQQLSIAAIESLRLFCSAETLKPKLEKLLESTLNSNNR